MSTQQELVSRSLAPTQAREVVLALERNGVDAGRIHVDAMAPTTPIGVGRVDRQAVGRPGARVGIGVLIGAAVGLLVGLATTVVADAPIAASLLALAIMGAVLGGLTGLYARLPMTAEIGDVDTGQAAVVRVDVTDLPEADIEDIGHELQTS